MSAENATPAPEVQQDENHIIAERRAKLAEWRKTGGAFPNDYRRENYAGKLHELYDDQTREELEAAPVSVKVASRIMRKRVMGKASFVTIQDVSGRIQLFVNINNVGEEVYEAFKRFDIGDFVGAAGTMTKTKTGELSVAATELRLLTKTI